MSKNTNDYMELDHIVSIYYIYRKGGYKINIHKHPFRKLEIDIINNTLDIYLEKDEYDTFMKIIKYNKLYKS